MLVFPSATVVGEVLAELDQEVENHTSSFMAEWGHLNDEELNAKIAELGFEENQPYMNFENYFQFNSLRKKIFTDEANWLANTDGEDIESDPDNHFIDDETMRTILNENLQVKVGNAIYTLTEEGYIITENGISTTVDLTGLDGSNLLSLSSKSSNFTMQSLNSDACRSMVRKSGFEYNYNNTRRIKWVISHWVPIWSPKRVMAKTKSYKKESNKWKKYSTQTCARPFGSISGPSGDCSSQANFNQNMNSKCEKGKKVKFPIWVQTNTKSGWIQGHHAGAEGVSYTSTLTF